MKNYLSFFIFYLLFTITCCGQDCRIKKEQHRLILINENGIKIDTVFYQTKADIKGDTAWIYNFRRGSLPDRCPWSFISLNKVVVSNEGFNTLENKSIHIGSVCGNLFDDSATCIVIKAAKVRRKSIFLEVRESHDSHWIKLPITIFDKRNLEEIVLAELEKIIRKRECIYLEVK